MGFLGSLNRAISFYGNATVSRDLLLGLVAAVVSFSTTVSCGPKTKKKITDKVQTECVLPENQIYSLQGRWAAPPIKLSFKNNEWDSAQITEIQAGANTWNAFFNLSKGFSIFDAGPAGTGNVSSASQATPSCASGTLTDGTVIYNRSSGWTKSATAIAVTTTCFSTTNGIARIFNSIMEFNYVSFFNTASGRFPDLQSIALHEMGHLMGLDHSCGPLGRPNANKPNVACPDPNASPDDPLVQAVMFRNVLFDSAGNGEVKRELQDNDQGRANCLYQ